MIPRISLADSIRLFNRSNSVINDGSNRFLGAFKRGAIAFMPFTKNDFIKINTNPEEQT